MARGIYGTRFLAMSLYTYEKVVEKWPFGKPFATPLSISAQPAALAHF